MPYIYPAVSKSHASTRLNTIPATITAAWIHLFFFAKLRVSVEAEKSFAVRGAQLEGFFCADSASPSSQKMRTKPTNGNKLKKNTYYSPLNAVIRGGK